MPPAIIAAGIGAVGAIGGGLLAAHGASSAAHTEASAQQQAIAAQQQQQTQTRSDLAPYRTAGGNALTAFGNLVGTNGDPAQGTAISALQQSPYYKSLYQNGLEATLQNASATGGIRGGNTQTALARFGTDTLSQTIQNQLGNLGGLAGLGESAAGQTAQLNQQGANAVSGIDTAGGATQASYQTAQAGALSGMFKNLAGFAQYAVNPPAQVGAQANAFNNGSQGQINVTPGGGSQYGNPFMGPF